MILKKKKYGMRKSNLFVILSIFLIKELHQKRLSPKLNKIGTRCRFYPSCSNYGIAALKKYGFITGWIKTINRIWRCKPNNYDSCIDFP